jgi:hypothetical protein
MRLFMIQKTAALYESASVINVAGNRHEAKQWRRGGGGGLDATE